jgi:Redoxin
MSRLLLTVLLLALSALTSRAQEAPASSAALLTDIDGRRWTATELAGKTGAFVLAWTSLECPMAKVYRPRLEALAKEFGAKGTRFVVVDSAVQDSRDEIKAGLRIGEPALPIVADPRGELAARFEVTRTTEVLLLDAGAKVHYRGAIDDQYGYRRGEDGVVGTYRKAAAERHYLADALRAHLAKKPLPKPHRTDPLGCLMTWPRKSGAKAPGYHETVEPILRRHCQSCHREEGFAPFALTDFEEVQGWAGMIDEVVQGGRMPPWNADPKVGHFKNARRLSVEEKSAIRAWVAGGAARGDEAKALPPLPPQKAWGIGEPDIIYALDEFEIPAEGRLDYRYVKVKTEFEEDRWIQSFQVRSTAPEVVHHVLVFAQPERVRDRAERRRLRKQRPYRPGFNFFDAVKNVPREEMGFYIERANKMGRRAPLVAQGGGLGGYFMSNLPGNGPTFLEEDQGLLLPKGATLVFQIHYTPSGKKLTSKTELGIRFRTTPPKRAIDTAAVSTIAFRIEPGESDCVVENDTKLRRDAKLLALKPHMHLRGKAFRYVAILPDGEERHLLEVPAYDFDWQHEYILAEPMYLPKGTVMKCRAVFDNSQDNPYNPAPDEEVFFGLQTDEEMMIGYFTVEWEPGQRDWAKQGAKVEASEKGEASKEESASGEGAGR